VRVTMLWSEKDSKNLERIANAFEELVGKKTFVPSKENVQIELVEEDDESLKEEQEAQEKKISGVLSENKGHHVWEETNLEEEQLGDELQ